MKVEVGGMPSSIQAAKLATNGIEDFGSCF